MSLFFYKIFERLESLVVGSLFICLNLLLLERMVIFNVTK